MIAADLVDANLPAALARAISAAGYAAVHVDDLGKDRDEDIDIWRAAEDRNVVVMSKDADFAMLALANTNSQALVWLRMGNTRKRPLIERVLHVLPDIIDALEHGERIVEVR